MDGSREAPSIWENSVGESLNNFRENMIPTAALEEMLREKGKRAYSGEVVQMATELLQRRIEDGEKVNADIGFLVARIPKGVNRAFQSAAGWDAIERAVVNIQGFSWAFTEEGSDFWLYVYRHLDNLLGKKP